MLDEKGDLSIIKEKTVVQYVIRRCGKTTICISVSLAEGREHLRSVEKLTKVKYVNALLVPAERSNSHD